MAQIHFLVGLAVGVIGISGAALMLQPAQQTVPPTDAFSLVYINNERIMADSYNDMLNITTEGLITTTVDEPNNSITLSMSEFNCPIFQGVVGFDENGDPICGVI